MANERSILLFGPTTAVADTREVHEFSTVHCSYLLAFIAMHADRDHSRDQLIEALWPSKIDGAAGNRLSVTLYHLRRTLEELDPGFSECIVASRCCIRLDSSKIQVDVHEFRDAIASARETQDKKTRRRCYEDAMKLFVAPLSPDIRSVWAIARQIETSEMFHEAAIWLALDAEEQGDRDRSMGLLGKALDREPHSERSTELLTNWYTQSGEPELAISCAKRLSAALASHGRSPTKSMIDRIEELDHILVAPTKAVVLADEMTLSVLTFDCKASNEIRLAISHHGGKLSETKRCGLFQNPIEAVRAGQEILLSAPDTRALVHTMIMAPEDDVPTVSRSTLKAMPHGGLYCSESSMWLLKNRGVKPTSEIKGRVRLFRYA